MTKKVVKQISIDEIDIPAPMDLEGYHVDSEQEMKYEGDGVYTITVKHLGRSDKTVK